MLRGNAKLRIVIALVLCGCATAGETGGDNNDDDGSGGEGGEGGAGGSLSASSASGTGGDSTGTFGIGGGGSGGGSGSVCDVAAMQEVDATCKVAVSIDKFMVSGPSCFVDSPLVNGTAGELSFACGDGPATLSFPNYVFTGTSSACSLDLSLKTQFLYSDGCTWESTQTIVGPMNGDLLYTYSEAPISGSNCAEPCTVDATLLLEQASPVDVEPPK